MNRWLMGILLGVALVTPAQAREPSIQSIVNEATQAARRTIQDRREMENYTPNNSEEVEAWMFVGRVIPHCQSEAMVRLMQEGGNNVTYFRKRLDKNGAIIAAAVCMAYLQGQLAQMKEDLD